MLQQQAQTISLTRQMRVVLLSYFTRAGFRWPLVGAAVGLALKFGALVIARLMGHYDVEPVMVLDLASTLGGLTIFAGALCALMLFFLHARQQLMGTSARLVPASRNANLIVAAALFFLIAAAIALPSVLNVRLHFFGVFIVVLGFMTSVGYTVCNPWLAPLPAVLALLAVRNFQAWEVIYEMTRSFNLRGHVPPNRWAERLWESQDRSLFFLRTSVTLATVLALIGLEKLAHPPKRSLSLRSVLSMVLPRPKSSDSASPSKRHDFLESLLARSLHRRFAVHDWRATGVAALGMGALSVWLGLKFPHEAPTVLTVLLAFLPGVLVAVGWRERWPSFDFESLYPVSRRQFMTDMAAGLLLDAAEFWIGGLLAIVLTMICIRARILADGRLWAALLAGGMMQFLWIGAIFWAGSRRQTLAFILGLVPVAIAVFATFDALWQLEPPAFPSRMVAIAAIEMFVGLMLLAFTLYSSSRPAHAQV